MLFALICVVAIVCVGAPFGCLSEIAEINGDKNVDTGSEEILAATDVTDVADKTVGNNVKANFTASNGEVKIRSTSGTGTIKNSGTNSLNNFWNTCGVENIKRRHPK